MFLVGCGLHLAGVGDDDVRILKPVGEIVNHHVVEHARLLVLLADIEVVFHSLVSFPQLVEGAFGNVQLGRSLRHGVDERVELQLRVRTRHVLEVKRQPCHKHGEDDERTHDLGQRDARRLHGDEFEPFAKIAECHEGGQQHRQRGRGRPQGQCRVIEKLRKNNEVQAFAHHVVHSPPEELHHEDEQANERCPDEQQDKAFDDKYI